MAEVDAKAALQDLIDGFDDAGIDHEAIVGRLVEFLTEHAADGFVCVMRPRPPTPAVTFPGVEGVSKAWADWGASFENLQIQVEEVIETDRHLLLLVEQMARTRHGGVPITQPSAVVFEFDGDGHPSAVNFHIDRDEARRLAGASTGRPD